MLFTVRCKFYVTAVEARRHQHLSEDHPDNVPYATVHFNAVKSSDTSSENYTYWTASPNGQMKLTGKLADLEQYLPGTYWYIDFTLLKTWDNPMSLSREDFEEYRKNVVKPNIWQLRSMETSSDLSQLSVKLGMTRGWHEINGEFAVSIQNKNVWSQYQSLGDLYEVSISQTTKE